MSAAKFAAKHVIKEISPTLFEILSDTKADPFVRIESLKAFAASDDPKLSDAIKIAFDDANAAL